MELIYDSITLIASGLLLLLSLLTSFCSGFFRCPVKSLKNSEVDGEKHTGEEPRISVVFNIEGDSDALRRNLPAYLQQDYAGGYDIIVVIRKGDSEVEDVMAPYENNPKVYCTYVPDSSRYMSKPKLAVTLASKASKSDWLLLADICSVPASEKWLSTMTSRITDGIDMVLGYSKFDSSMSSYRRFFHMHTVSYLIREYIKGTPYRAISKNLLFKKSMFMDRDGYRGNLKYIGGEYDFLVNKYATGDNTTFVFERDAWLLTEPPTDKIWRNGILFYQENRKHMNRSMRHRLPYVVDQCALHLNYLLIVGVAVFACITNNWIMLSASILALIMTIAIRTIIGTRFARAMDEQIKSWQIVPYELVTLWYNIHYRLKYIHSDKYDFISHKI